jgi:CBS domain-containing protein
MTSPVVTARTDDTLVGVARAMRDLDIGAMPVVDAAGAFLGIVTDRDIVVRAIAEGNARARVTDVVSESPLVTLSPDDLVADAVTLMGERGVRRLPVVVGGECVGIVSIGDLAVAREPGSALGRISASAGNR